MRAALARVWRAAGRKITAVRLPAARGDEGSAVSNAVL